LVNYSCKTGKFHPKKIKEHSNIMNAIKSMKKISYLEVMNLSFLPCQTATEISPTIKYGESGLECS